MEKECIVIRMDRNMKVIFRRIKKREEEFGGIEKEKCMKVSGSKMKRRGREFGLD